MQNAKLQDPMMDDIKTISLVTTPDSRFVVFSDAHRSDGTGADDFAANSLIFKCALDYYLAAINPPKNVTSSMP